MSPVILPRAAAAAAPRAIIGRRQLSFISSMRNAARLMEAHPFERLSVVQTAAKADWSVPIKRTAAQIPLYLGFFGVILGWPVGVRKVQQSLLV